MGVRGGKERGGGREREERRRKGEDQRNKSGKHYSHFIAMVTLLSETQEVSQP